MAVDPKRRIVTSLPLAVLWNDEGELDAHRVRDVGINEIKEMLRQGAVQFVVASGGSPLEWIPSGVSFEFWKNEAKPRIVPAHVDGFSIDDYPGGYCYCAALWSSQESGDIIVLETHH